MAYGGKSVTTYHYFKVIKYTDTTKTTNAFGQIALTQTFGSRGQRQYYATFTGDTSYAKAMSSVRTINVGSGAATFTTIFVNNPTPAVNQKVTFTATLKSGTTSLAYKPVSIYHYVNGGRFTDTTKTTNAAGQITFIQIFGSKGQRQYYATFAGDGSYFPSISSGLTITVH